MQKNKFNKRKSSANKFSSKQRRNKSTVSTVSTYGGFPDRQRVTLRYATNFNRTTPGIGSTSYFFRGNGPFDPDFTSTGGQPVNWDDFSAIYQRYRVWSSKITWMVANTASGTLDMVSGVVGPRHASTALSTLAAHEAFQCQPYTKYQKNIIYNNGTRSQSGSLSMSTHKFFGLTVGQFQGQDDCTSLVTTVPNHEWFWCLNFVADDQSSSTVLYINVILEYDIEFWDRFDTTLDFISKADRFNANRAAFVKYNQREEKSGRKDSDAKSERKVASDRVPHGREVLMEPAVANNAQPASSWSILGRT